MIKFYAGIVLFLSFEARVHSQIILPFDALKNLPFIAGIEAGVCSSSLQLEKSNSDFEKKTPTNKIGYKFGIDLLHRLDHHIDLETGIYLVNVGQKRDYYFEYLASSTLNQSKIFVWYSNSVVKFDTLSYATKGNETYSLNYLYIPFKVNYNFNSLFVTGGLYVSVLMNGIFKYNATRREYYTDKLIEDYSMSEKVAFNSDNKFNYTLSEKSYSKFDLGLNFGVGYRIERVTFKAAFDFGLQKLVDYKSQYFMVSDMGKDGFNNRTLSLSLVYYFSKNYYNFNDK